MRRFCVIILVFLLSVSFSGCSYETRIDKAAIAETVTVQKGENGFIYTFYMLSNSDFPEYTSVEGTSFEQACETARQKYIPDLSLTNLELFIVSEDIYSLTLYDDVCFMAAQYYISPRTCVAVADEETMHFISEKKEAPEKIKKYIILKKNNNKELNDSLLSIFNSFDNHKNKDFNISYINSEKELKIIPFKILSEK